MSIRASQFISFIIIYCLANINLTFSNADFIKAELLKRINNPIPAWINNQFHSNLGENSSITSEMIDKTFAESVGHLTRYKIYNGVVNSCDKYTTPIADYFRNFVIELNDYVKLPNVDFIVITDDYPHEEKKFTIAVFGFCKCNGKENVILIPDYQVLELSKNQRIVRQIEAGIRYFPWKTKISKAVWRGGNTGGINMHNFKYAPRIKIVEISKRFPDLLDARINILYDFNEPQVDAMLKASDYLGKSMSIFEQMKYKYQVLLDGNCASWPGAYWRLHANCVILKPASDQIQWYYSLLKPWVHYIPISADLNDLVQKIVWAKNNDIKVQEIIRNANKLATQCLSYVDMLYYLYVMINKYAELQKT